MLASRAPAAAVLLSCLALLGWPTGAPAGPVTLEGVTFSDELGGFVIEDGWGRGTLIDPFVIVERVTGEGPAILIVRGFSTRFGNRIGSQHLAGFALTKIVINDTPESWQEYRLELQQTLGDDSPYGDGLSYGQGPTPSRPLASDRFRSARFIDEPYDAAAFTAGHVGPGERVTFSFAITDMTPESEFFLVQRRFTPVAAVPAEGTLVAADEW